MSDQPKATAIAPAARRSNTERVLEVLLMVFCAADIRFHACRVDEMERRRGPASSDSERVRSGRAQVYAVQRFRPHRGQGQIMDMGFDEEGLERSAVIERTLRFVLTTAAFFAAHLAIRLPRDRPDLHGAISGGLWKGAMVGRGALRASLPVIHDRGLRYRYT